MNKTILFLSSATILLIVLLSISVTGYKSLLSENNRLNQNQTTLLSDIAFYKTENDHSAARVMALTLTKEEVERNFRELSATCDELKIKIQRLQSASTTVSETAYGLQATMRDSIRIIDSLLVDTLKCIAYQDRWLTFSACTQNGIDFDTNIRHRDTIRQIIHRIPKRWWFIKYGTKGIRQEVILSNPNSDIVFTEYIELKNR